jgi:hypothetical protein
MTFDRPVLDAICDDRFPQIRELPDFASQREALVNLALTFGYPIDNLVWLFTLYVDARKAIAWTYVKGGDRGRASQ